MTSPQMIYKPGQGIICGHCNYAFCSQPENGEWVVIHSTADDVEQPWLKKMFADCPLAGKKFKVPEAQKFTLEEIK